MRWAYDIPVKLVDLVAMVKSYTALRRASRPGPPGLDENKAVFSFKIINGFEVNLILLLN